MDSPTLKTLHGEITFTDAVQEEHTNMLQCLNYRQEMFNFLTYLQQHKGDIEAAVSNHMGLKKPQQCQLTAPSEWMHGSFNICLPVNIFGSAGPVTKTVIIRLPLPYKTGETKHPGNSDEKLRCEAANYVWIQNNCPDVTIPRLWGFAFSDGHEVSWEAVGMGY